MSIPQSPPTKQQTAWQSAIKQFITCPKTLLKRLNICEEQLAIGFYPDFPMRVSESFVSKMQLGDPKDPLLLQVLSLKQEGLHSEGFSCDPLQEKQFNPVPGLLHKFQSRVLITATQACPVHCRFCFRRHFAYANNRISPAHWQEILHYITAHSSIEEIIFSGGDPLMLTDKHLSTLLDDLNKLSQIKSIRFHTRMPVMVPERIDAGFLKIIKRLQKKIVLVYHINHPNEICQSIAAGAKALRDLGCLILNQGVILKNINDDVEILKSLSWRLFEANILPYYLHSLDSVQGAAHFAVPISTALELEQQLSPQLPGYLLPKFVKEVPGKPAKMVLRNIE